VRNGGGWGGVARVSRGSCKEFRLDAPALGLILPSVAGGGTNKSSGTCCAVVSSTRIRSTFKASLPKLKKEKKYLRMG
jgi:hypothetical protein